MKQPARVVPTASGAPASEDPRWPLYVAPADAPRFVGSDPVAVLGAAGLAARLSRPAALSFLVHDQYDCRRTFFDGLASVPVRCPVEPTAGGLRVAPGERPPLLSLDTAEAAQAVRATVDAATEEAVRAHDGVALLLSGGLDSSILAIAASTAWRRSGRDETRLRFYHILPAEGAGESRYAQAVADRLGHPYAEIRPVAGDPFEGAEAFFALLDAPPDNLGPRTMLAVGRRLSDEGATLLLAGEGGDEVFGAIPRAGLRTFVRRLLPEAVRRRLRPRRSCEDLPAFLAATAPPIPSIDLRPPPRSGLRGSRALRDTAIRCARNGIIATWWRAWGQLFGIEVGLLLLDPRVTDLAVGVPGRTHARAPLDRALERAAYADQLPEPVLARGKDQPPLEGTARNALQIHGEAWRERWVTGGAIESAGWLTPAQSRDLLVRGSSGSGSGLNRALCLVNLELWAAARRVRNPR